jgi:hypothetical protein
VPKTLRQKINVATHGDIMTGHESKKKIKKIIISSYWWPGMDTEMDIHMKSCDKCRRTRKDRRGSTTFASPLPQGFEPNQRIHRDLFGPLKTMPSGKKFQLCTTDAFSK